MKVTWIAILLTFLMFGVSAVDAACLANQPNYGDCSGSGCPSPGQICRWFSGSCGCYYPDSPTTTTVTTTSTTTTLPMYAGRQWVDTDATQSKSRYVDVDSFVRPIGVVSYTPPTPLMMNDWSSEYSNLQLYVSKPSFSSTPDFVYTVEGSQIYYNSIHQADVGPLMSSDVVAGPDVPNYNNYIIAVDPDWIYMKTFGAPARYSRSTLTKDAGFNPPVSGNAFYSHCTVSEHYLFCDYSNNVGGDLGSKLVKLDKTDGHLLASYVIPTAWSSPEWDIYLPLDPHWSISSPVTFDQCNANYDAVVSKDENLVCYGLRCMTYSYFYGDFDYQGAICLDGSLSPKWKKMYYLPFDNSYEPMDGYRSSLLSETSGINVFVYVPNTINLYHVSNPHTDIFFYDADTGNTINRYSLGEVGTSVWDISMATDDQFIYFSNKNGPLTKLAYNGGVEWTKPGYSGKVTVNNNEVMVSDGTYAATFNKQTGDLIWSEPLTVAPAVSGKSWITISPNGEIVQPVYSSGYGGVVWGQATVQSKCFVVYNAQTGQKVSGATVRLQLQNPSEDSLYGWTGTTDSTGKACTTRNLFAGGKHKLTSIAASYIDYTLPGDGTFNLKVEDLGPVGETFPIAMMPIPVDNVICTSLNPEYKMYCIFPKIGNTDTSYTMTMHLTTNNAGRTGETYGAPVGLCFGSNNHCTDDMSGVPISTSRYRILNFGVDWSGCTPGYYESANRKSCSLAAAKFTPDEWVWDGPANGPSPHKVRRGKTYFNVSVDYVSTSLLCRTMGCALGGIFCESDASGNCLKESYTFRGTYSMQDCYVDSDCAAGQYCGTGETEGYRVCKNSWSWSSPMSTSVFNIIDRPTINLFWNLPTICKKSSASWMCDSYTSSEIGFIVQGSESSTTGECPSQASAANIVHGITIDDDFHAGYGTLLCGLILRDSDRHQYDACISDLVNHKTFNYRVCAYLNVGDIWKYSGLSLTTPSALDPLPCADNTLDRKCHFTGNKCDTSASTYCSSDVACRDPYWGHCVNSDYCSTNPSRECAIDETCWNMCLPPGGGPYQDGQPGICRFTREACIQGQNTGCTNMQSCNVGTHACGGGSSSTSGACIEIPCVPGSKSCTKDSDCSGCSYIDDYSHKITSDSCIIGKCYPSIKYCAAAGTGARSQDECWCNSQSTCNSKGIYLPSNYDPNAYGFGFFCDRRFSSVGETSIWVPGDVLDYTPILANSHCRPLQKENAYCTRDEECREGLVCYKGGKISGSDNICNFLTPKQTSMDNVCTTPYSGYCYTDQLGTKGTCYTVGTCILSSRLVCHGVSPPPLAQTPDEFCVDHPTYGTLSYCDSWDNVNRDTGTDKNTGRCFTKDERLGVGAQCRRDSWCKDSEKCTVKCIGADNSKMGACTAGSWCTTTTTLPRSTCTPLCEQNGKASGYCSNYPVASPPSCTGLGSSYGPYGTCVSDISVGRTCCCYGTATTTTTTLPGAQCNYAACSYKTTVGDMQYHAAIVNGQLCIDGRGCPTSGQYNGCNNQCGSAGARDSWYCSQNGNSGAGGYCRQLKEQGALCGSDSGDVDKGDFVCKGYNCVGDSYWATGARCQAATTKCLSNVITVSASLGADPEAYCHQEISDGRGGPDGTSGGAIIYGVTGDTPDKKKSQAETNVKNGNMWCYNEYFRNQDARPPGIGYPDSKCYVKREDGAPCEKDYQCMGSCGSSYKCTSGGNDKHYGEECTIKSSTSSTSYYWNSHDNGESTGMSWIDNCQRIDGGINLYCNPCTKEGFLYGTDQPGKTRVACNSENAKVFHNILGWCDYAHDENEWCYSSGQCISNVRQFGDIFKKLSCSESATYPSGCDGTNPFCSTSNCGSSSSLRCNKHCQYTAIPPCIHDAQTPVDQFTMKSDENCYTMQQRDPSISPDSLFCDDQQLCHMPGSTDSRYCETFSPTERTQVEHVKGNCVKNYCPRQASPYLSIDCWRAPGFYIPEGTSGARGHHVADAGPESALASSLVYCDANGGIAGSSTQGGLCRWRKERGERCTGFDPECMPGLYCINKICSQRSCTKDADCALGDKCVNGVCQSKGGKGILIYALNGLSRPVGSPLEKITGMDYDFVVSCNLKDYSFKYESDDPIQMKYKIGSTKEQWFGASENTISSMLDASFPDLCSKDLISNIADPPYKIVTITFIPVLDGVPDYGLQFDRKIMVLARSLSINKDRCNRGSLNSQKCPTQNLDEGKNMFILLQNNTYRKGDAAIMNTPDVRVMACYTTNTPDGVYVTDMMPRTSGIFGGFDFAYIENWANGKYFRCIDQYGSVYDSSFIFDPVVALKTYQFSPRAQIFIILIVLIGIPTLVLAGARARK